MNDSSRPAPVNDNPALFALYWITLVLGIAGLITWIAGSLNVYQSSYLSGDRINTTAQAWAALGLGAFTVGFIGFFLALATHAVNWQILNRSPQEPERRSFAAYKEEQRSRGSDEA